MAEIAVRPTRARVRGGNALVRIALLWAGRRSGLRERRRTSDQSFHVRCAPLARTALLAEGLGSGILLAHIGNTSAVLLARGRAERAGNSRDLAIESAGHEVVVVAVTTIGLTLAKGGRRRHANIGGASRLDDATRADGTEVAMLSASNGVV